LDKIAPSDPSAEEIALVNAFVVPARRERIIELLLYPKRRRKVLTDLAHFRRNLTSNYLSEIPPATQGAMDIECLLRANGASMRCLVISENPLMDRREMKISEALERTVGSGMGTIISCIPGRLAYFEGEALGERYLLKK
jgi:hypothetical protein